MTTPFRERVNQQVLDCTSICSTTSDERGTSSGFDTRSPAAPDSGNRHRGQDQPCNRDEVGFGHPARRPRFRPPPSRVGPPWCWPCLVDNANMTTCAPAQTVHFHQKHYTAVVSGAKVSTVRWREDIHEGPAIFIFDKSPDRPPPFRTGHRCRNVRSRSSVAASSPPATRHRHDEFRKTTPGQLLPRDA